MTHRAKSRRWLRIVAALVGVSLSSSAMYMLYQGSRRMYYDYYFYSRVKEHYIAPAARQRVIDTAVPVGILFALYLAYRLLRYSFAVRANPASDR
jgi:hypothetical protein